MRLILTNYKLQFKGLKLGNIIITTEKQLMCMKIKAKEVMLEQVRLDKE